MAEIVNEIARRRGTEPALTDEFGVTSWRDLDERVNRLVHALRGAGIGPGSTFAVLSGNRREMFELFLAAGVGGYAMVPINWHFVADEVSYVLENSDAAALFVDTRFTDVATAAAARVPACGLRVVIGATGGGSEFVDYEELLATADRAEPEGQALGGPMFYTSGTTGRPKGVRSSLLSAGADTPASVLALVAGSITGSFGFPTDGTTLLCGPVYHSAQWAFALLPVFAGCGVVMRHKFEVNETLELIDREQITNVHLVPTQFTRLLRADPDVRAAFRGDSLQLVLHGAAPCPPDVKRQMIEWWGPKITEYYGGTEGAIISFISSAEWLAHPTSVGKVLSSVEPIVLGDDGEPLEVGETGQLYFRNLLGLDFEYHKEPDKTSAAHLEPGVFTLGDVGHVDAEGYLHLSDRKIDMIISGGVNIYPAEIEMALAAHPSVRDVAVFGIPDDEFGEQVKAVVELHDEAKPSADLEADELRAELLAYGREHLAGYKVPRSIDFVDSLPRSPTGKLSKRLLRDPYWEGSGRSM
jgi:long-chain acyl-CoA synthetase